MSIFVPKKVNVGFQNRKDTYTGNLLTSGHYIGYSEWTITGFDLDSFVLGGHDLKKELENHLGQYVHFILMDELEEL